MKNTKTLFRFFTLFEYEEEQSFLEKQHKCVVFTQSNVKNVPVCVNVTQNIW